MKLKSLVFGAVSALALVSPAMADADYGGFSGYVDVTTDYRFRGISNSDLHPTIQGAINWSNDGWYAGTWASGVDFNDPPGSGTTFELDLYGGKHIALDDDGTDLNLEAYYYAYPDQPGGAHYSYFEAIAGVSHSWDALSAGIQGAWSPEFFGKTGDAWWVAGNVSYAATDWMSISGNLGHQWIDLGTDYTHWDLGATFTWEQFALDVRYVDTSLSVAKCAGSHICDATAVATLTWNIP